MCVSFCLLIDFLKLCFAKFPGNPSQIDFYSAAQKMIVYTFYIFTLITALALGCVWTQIPKQTINIKKEKTAFTSPIKIT